MTEQAYQPGPEAALKRVLDNRSRGVSMAEADVERSDARILPQLVFTNEQLQKLQGMISELDMKINPILMPSQEDPRDVPEPKVPSYPSSELSVAIDDINNQIARAQRRIYEIFERVQL